MPGLLTHSPARVISRILIEAGHGTEPPVYPSTAYGSWPLFYDNEPDGTGVPDSVITVFDTAGIDHGREMVTGERCTHDGIQVRVRCKRKQDGWTKANAIALFLSGLTQKTFTIDDPVLSLSKTYKVQSVRLTGTVIPLGKEVNTTQRNVFTLNALVTIRML